eukprot:scaffold421442_cov102-Attheya_sp.AAC.1
MMFSRKHKVIKYGFDKNNIPPPPQLPPGQTGHFSPSVDSNLWLFSRFWEPPKGTDIKATLIISHGTVDHSGVSHELASHLAKAGVLAVFAQDMRGWGLSDGESMYMNDIDVYVEGIDAVYNDIHFKPTYAK